MRTNTYKDRVLDVLQKEHLMRISDIHKKVRGANYSTIYRNVEQLLFEGLIRKVVLDRGLVMYEFCEEKNEHDHFLCTGCGMVEAIFAPALSLSLPDTYKVSDLLVRGLCKKCN
ncbi:MAG: transcriptional repressor [Patescibacteria group bacterium]|nr:transcriptional repressor [Patescibacteria group bacterium]